MAYQISLLNQKVKSTKENFEGTLMPLLGHQWPTGSHILFFEQRDGIPRALIPTLPQQIFLSPTDQGRFFGHQVAT